MNKASIPYATLAFPKTSFLSTKSHGTAAIPSHPAAFLSFLFALGSFYFSGLALLLLGISFLLVDSVLLGPVAWFIATFCPPPLILSGMALGLWRTKCCRRNPDLAGLRTSLAGVLLGYLALTIWYLLQVGFWLYLYPTFSVGGLMALALTGVILLAADGSRAAGRAALGLALFCILGTLTVTWAIQAREHARRAKVGETLRHIANGIQDSRKRNPDSPTQPLP